MAADSAMTEALSLVQRALPLTSSDELLAALSATWTSACAATSSFVSFVAQGQVEGVWLHDGQSRRITCAIDVWTAGEATGALSNAGVAVTDESMTVVPFRHLDRTVGGAILFGTNRSVDSEPLADISARLIEQLNSTEQDRRLRDLKLEAMAEFSAGAGHEINNPVATIVGRSSLLLKSETDPERRRVLETIGGQALRIRDMIGDAMTFARPPKPKLEPVPAAQAVHSVVDELRDQFQRQATELHLELDDSISIPADHEQFRVVVSSLLRNSIEAVRNGGQIGVQLSQEDDRTAARLTVRDNGPGLTAIEAEHLFDPFFSGRQAGRGLGFGLSKCWQILRQHDGWIDVETKSGETGFTIHSVWPIHPKSE